MSILSRLEKLEAMFLPVLAEGHTGYQVVFENGGGILCDYETRLPVEVSPTANDLVFRIVGSDQIRLADPDEGPPL